MKVGDLVRHWNARQSYGLVVKVLTKTEAEVLWMDNGILHGLVQQIQHLEVVNESR